MKPHVSGVVEITRGMDHPYNNRKLLFRKAVFSYPAFDDLEAFELYLAGANAHRNLPHP